MAKKVNIKELARRYTTAIFELAKSTGALTQLGTDLEVAESVINSDAKLKSLLQSPLLSEKDQVKVVRELGKQKNFHSLTVNFLLIVARNGRLQYLPEIISSFRQRIAEENGEITVELISAQKLAEKQVQEVAKDLSAKTGKKVIISEVVRPEILGGLIIKIGPKMFDFSIKSRLSKLKGQLKTAS